MQDSIFTKIIDGEIPGEIIYEDEMCVVLLTIQPFSPGHLLVIPREQIDHLWDIDNKTYHHLWDIVHKMAEKLKQTYTYDRVGVVVEGYGVPHAHIHVFGYEQPLKETIVDFSKKIETIATAEMLRIEADKLRDR